MAERVKTSGLERQGFSSLIFSPFFSVSDEVSKLLHFPGEIAFPDFSDSSKFVPANLHPSFRSRNCEISPPLVLDQKVRRFRGRFRLKDHG